MRSAILALGLLAFMIACEQKKTTTVDEHSNMTTIQTVGLDKQRIDSTAEKVENATQRAAEKTGAALEDAGHAIKKENEKIHTRRSASDTIK